MSSPPARLDPLMLPMPVPDGGVASARAALPLGALQDLTPPMRASSGPPNGLRPDPGLPMKVDFSVRATSPVRVELAELAVKAWSRAPAALPVASSNASTTAGAATDAESDMSMGTSPTSMSPSGTASSATSHVSAGGGGAPLLACTTVAIMNIPYTYPVSKFQAEVDAARIPYDYFHCPQDSRKGRNRGFAFINFTSVEAARAFHTAFHNRVLSYPGDQEKQITVQPSSLQGFEGNAKLHPFAAARTTVRNSGARGQGARTHGRQHGGKRGAARCATGAP